MGAYTFKIQEQMYRFLDHPIPGQEITPGIQLYFYDTDMEITKHLENSPQLNGQTVKILMQILRLNPYKIFFQRLHHVPNICHSNIRLNSNPGLDQRVYNLPSTSQVAAIVKRLPKKQKHQTEFSDSIPHPNFKNIRSAFVP